MLAGNLESNFNKLEIFVDSVPGGQNLLRSDNPDVDFNGLNRMAGLIFDAGFESDYFVTLTGGDISGMGEYGFFASYAETNTDGGGFGTFLGGGSGRIHAGDLDTEFAIDNSNVDGVDGGCDGSNGSGVTTGVEVRLPLAILGNPSECVDVVAFINGSGHDFASNQFLAPLPPGTCNLGEPSVIDLNGLAGIQYFTVCPSVVPVERTTWGSVKAQYR